MTSSQQPASERSDMAEDILQAKESAAWRITWGASQTMQQTSGNNGRLKLGPGCIPTIHVHVHTFYSDTVGHYNKYS